MKDKKGLIVVIIAAVVAVLMIVVTLVVTLQGNKPHSEKENATTTEVQTTPEPTTSEPTTEDYLNYFNEYIEKGEVSNALNCGYMYLDESKDETGIKEVYTKIAEIYAEYGNYGAAITLLKESGIDELGELYSAYDGMYEGKEGYFCFGSYPQSAYTKDELPEYVVNASFDSNNYACIYGVEYIKGEDVYYAYEPVSWWVIGENINAYSLLSEKILDTKKFHNSFGAVTWNVCDLRNWLNEDFYNTCFTNEDKVRIINHFTPASHNYIRDHISGAETYNYVSAMTATSLADGRYVFPDHQSEESKALRIAQGTDYAIANGLKADDNNNGRWWTATSADTANLYTVVITEDGTILIESGGEVNNKNDVGVRPFIMVEKEVTNATN